MRPPQRPAPRPLGDTYDETPLSVYVITVILFGALTGYILGILGVLIGG